MIGLIRLVVVLSVLPLTGAAHAQSRPGGAWVGTFERQGLDFPLEVTFDDIVHTKAAVRITYGSLAVRLAGFDSASLAQSDGDLVLTVGDAAGRVHSFAGRQYGDTIRGRYSANGGEGGLFQLLRTVVDDDLQRWAGTYLMADGAMVNVYVANRSLVLADLGDGRLRALVGMPGGTFVHGHALRVPYPVAGKVRFTASETGAMMYWHDEGRERIGARAPVRVEEVRFRGDNVELGGSLLVPSGPGPFPAVVLTHGGGPAERSRGPVVTAVLAAGFAVLTYDKRGVGSSTGDWRASFEQYARDLIGGVDFLRERSEIDPTRIGVWGPSQGGWVAPLAATLSRSIAFVIVQAASGVSPIDQELYSLREWMRGTGLYSESDIAEAVAFQRYAYLAPLREDWDAYDQHRAEARDQPWFGEVSAPGRTSPGHQFWLWNANFDPVPVIGALRVPVLAIFGGRDEIVPSDTSVVAWRDARRAVSGDATTLVVLPDADHELYAASPRGPAARTGFATGYLAILRGWLAGVP
jgi:uncharacterized protein